MFTLEIEGKSRILQRAIIFWKCPHTTTVKEGTRSCGYNQERLFRSQEKTAASSLFWAGATDCKELLKKKREKKGGGGGKKAEWDHHEFGKNEAHPLGKIGEYTCIILHGLRVCVKSVMRCGEFLYCSDSSCLTVAGELKQLFLKNYMSCLTRYTNSLLKN